MPSDLSRKRQYSVINLMGRNMYIISSKHFLRTKIANYWSESDGIQIECLTASCGKPFCSACGEPVYDQVTKIWWCSTGAVKFSSFWKNLFSTTKLLQASTSSSLEDYIASVTVKLLQASTSSSLEDYIASVTVKLLQASTSSSLEDYIASVTVAAI